MDAQVPVDHPIENSEIGLFVYLCGFLLLEIDQMAHQSWRRYFSDLCKRDAFKLKVDRLLTGNLHDLLICALLFVVAGCRIYCAQVGVPGGSSGTAVDTLYVASLAFGGTFAWLRMLYYATILTSVGPVLRAIALMSQVGRPA